MAGVRLVGRRRDVAGRRRSSVLHNGDNRSRGITHRETPAVMSSVSRVSCGMSGGARRGPWSAASDGAGAGRIVCAFDGVSKASAAQAGRTGA